RCSAFVDTPCSERIENDALRCRVFHDRNHRSGIRLWRNRSRRRRNCEDPFFLLPGVVRRFARRWIGPAPRELIEKVCAWREDLNVEAASPVADGAHGPLHCFVRIFLRTSCLAWIALSAE